MSLARILRRLWRGEQGQDLVEYTLMVAFLAMTSAALFYSAGGNANVVWVSASSTLQGAANPGSGSTSDTPPDTGDDGEHGDHGDGGHWDGGHGDGGY